MEIKQTSKLDQIYQDARSIRKAVFVNEQGIDEALEFDGTDAQATHYVAYENHRPVATARVTLTEAGVHIQRVATLKNFRNRGYAKHLLETILAAPQYAAFSRFYLGAQESAKGFYETLGFKQFGQPFQEVGIQHINMARPR